MHSSTVLVTTYQSSGSDAQLILNILSIANFFSPTKLPCFRSSGTSYRQPTRFKMERPRVSSDESSKSPMKRRRASTSAASGATNFVDWSPRASTAEHSDGKAGDAEMEVSRSIYKAQVRFPSIVVILKTLAELANLHPARTRGIVECPRRVPDIQAVPLERSRLRAGSRFRVRRSRRPLLLEQQR